MPVQDVMLKGVDVPAGFELTGEVRVPNDEWGLENKGKAKFFGGDNWEIPRIILRKTEPDAVKLARWAKHGRTAAIPEAFDILEAADRVIAEWEASK